MGQHDILDKWEHVRGIKIGDQVEIPNAAFINRHRSMSSNQRTTNRKAVILLVVRHCSASWAFEYDHQAGAADPEAQVDNL